MEKPTSVYPDQVNLETRDYKNHQGGVLRDKSKAVITLKVTDKMEFTPEQADALFVLYAHSQYKGHNQLTRDARSHELSWLRNFGIFLKSPGKLSEHFQAVSTKEKPKRGDVTPEKLAKGITNLTYQTYYLTYKAAVDPRQHNGVYPKTLRDRLLREQIRFLIWMQGPAGSDRINLKNRRYTDHQNQALKNKKGEDITLKVTTNQEIKPEDADALFVLYVYSQYPDRKNSSNRRNVLYALRKYGDYLNDKPMQESLQNTTPIDNSDDDAEYDDI